MMITATKVKALHIPYPTPAPPHTHTGPCPPPSMKIECHSSSVWWYLLIKCNGNFKWRNRSRFLAQT